MIPKEKIEEVRDRANIVSVVSEYVPLAKKGANHVGLCPFHSEKTPSFTVNEEKKIYYCFGCNATGNAITFVMKKEGLSFPEAVKGLARKFGVIIEERKGLPDERELIYHALRLSAEYYSKWLSTAAGKPAREYLKKRGFEGEIVERFALGFAPDAWEALSGYLKKKGIPMELAEKAGLVSKKEKGYYDRFRTRLIFPIADAKGRVIGFGGRSLDGREPKYLNSPESAVFKKGETLYGFHQAKQGMTKEGSAIVVEGYFDLIALHKHGFTNSVATMGTALTPGHIRALKGYAGTIYALFDSDQAGKNAAIRGLTLFLNEEMACRAVLLSQGKDPDEFLASAGPSAMKEAIEKAEPLMEFYLDELKKKINTDTPEGKKKYLDSALQYLSKVKNVAERGHYSAILASNLGISVDSIYEALKAPAKNGGPGRAVKDVMEARNSGSRLKELTILRVILTHPELYSEKVEEAIGVFKDPVLKEAGALISRFCREGRTPGPAALMEEMHDEELRGKISGLLFRDEDGFIEAPERMLEDSLKRVLNKGKIKDSTEEMIRRLEATGRVDVARDIKKRIESGRSVKK